MAEQPSVIIHHQPEKIFTEDERPVWLMTDDRGYQIVLPKKKGQKKDERKKSDYVGFPLYAQQGGYIPPGKFLNVPITTMTMNPSKDLGYLPIVSGLNANAQKGILCHSNISDYSNCQPTLIVTLFNLSSELFTVKTDTPVAHMFCVKTTVLAVDTNNALRLIDPD